MTRRAILVALLASALLSGCGDVNNTTIISSEAPVTSVASSDEPNYTDFIAQVIDDPASIDSVRINTNDNTVDVTEDDGDEYTTGYPGNTEESLVNTLERKQIEVEVG